MLPKDLVLLPHEIKHYEQLDKLAPECTLFLKRDNHAFPIDKPCKVALFGSGARHTYKGGTGSGDVNSHFFNNIEEELELHGFEITTKKWLDAFDKLKEEYSKVFVKRVKREAKEKKMGAPAYSIGQNPNGFEHSLSIEGYEGDIALYILSRVSGEGADRRIEKGDVYLTDKEVEDILYLNKTYEKFMLVLNVGGPVDLTPVLEVNNIFLLSQLGVVTSSVLVNVLLGKANPSGKLATTWAKPNEYPFFEEFGDRDNTRYKEGIYVGYRYFDSNNIKPLFPFGYGLSYSEFIHQVIEYNVDSDLVSLKVNVKNISTHPGKEVIQIYLSKRVEIDNPNNILVAFNKTKELAPNESEVLDISFKLRDFPNYVNDKHAYMLLKGDYLIRCGNCISDLEDIVNLQLDEDVLIKEVKSLDIDTGFIDYSPENKQSLDSSVKTIKLDLKDISGYKVNYVKNYEVTVPEIIRNLTLDELILLNLGDYKTGLAGVIGQAGSLAPGAAGETSLRIKSINSSLCMADGPAGLRLINEYKVNKNGTYHLTEDSILRGVKLYLPSFFANFLDVKKNHKKNGNIIYQQCTAIPIATALAQSFNTSMLYDIGRLVRDEMKLYDIDIWLAPGMNLHRNILCGRNFEYYSEDPYLTGALASSIVSGVEDNSDKMCTIKHFACNNQETNRFNNNSIVSERALREIYLSSFEYVVKNARPSSIMSSYNLLNGKHTSESHKLLVDILRNEWGYKGFVMTDWIVTGQVNDKSSVHPAAHAHIDLINGVNICMPGSKKDIKDIKKALKKGEITRKELENNAAILYQYIIGNKNR